MKHSYLTLLIFFFSCQQQVDRKQEFETLKIEPINLYEVIEDSIYIDQVWAGHPVDFSLLTHGDNQYIAYYNAHRKMVVGQRKLNNNKFTLHTLAASDDEDAPSTSTQLEWDSHNYITLALDKAGYIHLAGNMHVSPLTYFRSARRGDITTLEQVMEMVGSEEEHCTYPKFMNTRDGELVFQYRDGGSGNGNEIYNLYSIDSRHWKRLLSSPLTDGRGEMNAYLSQPVLKEDNWYHVYWVWRDTPDCSTNHDLSYMKSPDLKEWYSAFGKSVTLPVTIDDTILVVDPIPPGGGIINLAARLCLDENYKPQFVYHKYDDEGNLQLSSSRIINNKWVSHQLTDWDYRWEFKGIGSVIFEVEIKDFIRRLDGFYEVSFNHIKYGPGTLLLDHELFNRGEIRKPQTVESTLQVKGNFPGLEVKTQLDKGNSSEQDIRYLLKWETLAENRDNPRPEPWPEPSDLVLYKVRMP